MGEAASGEGARADGGRQGGLHAWQVALGVFLLALLTRWAWPDRPTNIDEPLWIRRGISFYIALLEGDWAGTYQRHHPGVINMWLVGGAFSLRFLLREVWALAPPLAEIAQGHSSLLAYLQALVAAPGYVFPLALYTDARLFMAPWTAAAVAGIVWLTQRLWGRPIALLVALFLLTEPFFLAYQRFLTTDANQSNFTWLSLLAFLLFLQQRGLSRRAARWLLVSGLCFGIAVLSKLSALLSLPTFLLWALWQALSRTQQPLRQRWKLLATALLPWGVAAGAVTVLLWPALWTTLPATALRLLADLQEELGGHYQFFLGQASFDPGPLYYPVTLLLRLSPALLAGIVLGLGTLATRAGRSHLARPGLLLAILLNLLTVFVGISLQSSKVDRYVMPLLPGLAILGATGWHALWGWMRGRWVRQTGHPSRNGAWVGAGLLVLAQAAILLPHFPLTVTYYNPLLGGGRMAQQLIMIGNGELLEEAAAWLNQQEETNPPEVASWYYEGFAPYYNGLTSAIDWGNEGDPFTWPWMTAHYAVLYINQLQRTLPYPELIEYFAMQAPLHTVRAHGLDYAMIYNGPGYRLEELEQGVQRTDLRFGASATLHGYSILPASPSGTVVPLTLYWEALAPFPAEDFKVDGAAAGRAGRGGGTVRGQSCRRAPARFRVEAGATHPRCAWNRDSPRHAPWPLHPAPRLSLSHPWTTAAGWRCGRGSWHTDSPCHARGNAP